MLFRSGGHRTLLPSSSMLPRVAPGLGGPLTCQPPTFSQAGPCTQNPVRWPGALTWHSAVLWPCRTFSRVFIYLVSLTFLLDFGGASPGGAVVKNPPANAEDLGSIRGSGRSPGGGNGSSTPVFLPRESHGQRSPWGHKESDTTERLSI